jgi:hypothetical protein
MARGQMRDDGVTAVALQLDDAVLRRPARTERAPKFGSDRRQILRRQAVDRRDAAAAAALAADTNDAVVRRRRRLLRGNVPLCRRFLTWKRQRSVRRVHEPPFVFHRGLTFGARARDRSSHAASSWDPSEAFTRMISSDTQRSLG